MFQNIFSCTRHPSANDTDAKKTRVTFDISSMPVHLTAVNFDRLSEARTTALHLCQLLTFFFLVCSFANAQPHVPPVVASFDGGEISSDDFALRCALTVTPDAIAMHQLATFKRDVLFSMLAERLLAAEARRSGVSIAARFQSAVKHVQESFVLDKLYRDDVAGKIVVTEKEVRAQFDRLRKALAVQFLFSEDREMVNEWMSLLERGFSFDSLLSMQEPSKAAAALAAFKEDPALQKIALALPSGSRSDAIETSAGQWILRNPKMDTAEEIETEFQVQRHSIERSLRRQKAGDRAIKFIRSLWKGKKTTLAKDHLAAIANAMKRELDDAAASDGSSVLRLTADAFERIREEMSQHLFEKCFSVGGDSVTVVTFLDWLERGQIVFHRDAMKSFGPAFQRATQEMTERYLLVREGYRRGLHQSEEVETAMRPWQESALAQSCIDAIWQRFIANDDSVWSYYLQNPRSFGPPLEVKLIEILHASSDTLAMLLRRVQRGEIFRQLAIEYSQRDGARERDAELGYFPVTKHPEFGREAMQMKIGDTSELLHLREGYSIFQLYGKRAKSDTTIMSIDDVRQAIERNWRTGTERTRLKKLVADKAEAGNLTIDEHALGSLIVVPSRLFTRRDLGFGGRVPNGPPLLPLADAVIEGMSRNRGRIR